MKATYDSEDEESDLHESDDSDEEEATGFSANIPMPDPGAVARAFGVPARHLLRDILQAMALALSPSIPVVAVDAFPPAHVKMAGRLRVSLLSVVHSVLAVLA